MSFKTLDDRLRSLSAHAAQLTARLGEFSGAADLAATKRLSAGDLSSDQVTAAKASDPEIAQLRELLTAIEEQGKAFDEKKSGPSLELRSRQVAVKDAELRIQEIVDRLAYNAGDGSRDGRSIDVVNEEGYQLRAEKAALEAQLPALRERLATYREEAEAETISAARRAVELEKLAIAKEKAEQEIARREAVYDERVAALKKLVGAEQESVDKITTAVTDAIPPRLARTVSAMRSLAAGASTNIVEYAQTAADKARVAADELQDIVKQLTTDDEDIFDYNGQPLEDFVASQKDKIVAIENTVFGGYLDAWANSYIELMRDDLDAERERGLQESLRVYRQAVRDYTGEAGRSLNFEKLAKDIDAALARMKAGIAEAADSAINRAKTTSGTVGAAPSGITATMSISLIGLSGGFRLK